MCGASGNCACARVLLPTPRTPRRKEALLGRLDQPGIGLSCHDAVIFRRNMTAWCRSDIGTSITRCMHGLPTTRSSRPHSTEPGAGMQGGSVRPVLLKHGLCPRAAALVPAAGLCLDGPTGGLAPACAGRSRAQMNAAIANLHCISRASEHPNASARHSGKSAARSASAAARASNRSSPSAVCDGSSGCLSLATVCLISRMSRHAQCLEPEPRGVHSGNADRKAARTVTWPDRPSSGKGCSWRCAGAV